jgi:hypothetical protein
MRQRPEAVKRICFYDLIGTPFIVLFGVILWWNGQGYLARGDNIGLWLQAIGVVCFVVALVGIVVTWGFWNLQRWAYHAERFMWTRGTGITFGIGKLLDTPDVREAFGLEVEPPRRDDSW